MFVGSEEWSRSMLWPANPGAQKHFDSEHPVAGDSKGSSLALVLYFVVLYSLFCVVFSH